jgi:hypothetical protein
MRELEKVKFPVHECHRWLSRRGMAGEQGDVLHASRLRPPTRRSAWRSSAKGERSSMVEDTPTSTKHGRQSRVMGTVRGMVLGEVIVIGIH